MSGQAERVREACTESRKNRQGSKPGRLEKENGVQEHGKNTLVYLKAYKKNWYRETGNTGINTLGKIRDTWRGWRQSQERVKQIRA